jgi:L-arabinose isomerase
MMGLEKPKIGLLFLTSGWFRDVGLQGESSVLTEAIETTAAEVIGRLSEFLEPVYSGILFSEAQAGVSARRIAAEGVDGLLIVPLVWCEDQILRAALKVLPKLPILLWVFIFQRRLTEFVPFERALEGSGSVAALQFSGMLKREGYSYRVVFGHHRDEGVYRQIRAHCLGMYVRRKLKNARIGILPFRCDQMSTTYVDEFELRRLYGVELSYLTLGDLKRSEQMVDRKRIKEFVKFLEGTDCRIEVDQRNLEQGIRYALAMEDIVRRDNLQVLAMNDVSEEMHLSLGMRPCLWNPEILKMGCVVSMEAEVAGGLAMYILFLVSGRSPFYTEPLTFDIEQNVLLLGHAGYHDASDRDPEYPLQVVADPEYRNSDPYQGAVSFFKYRPGAVTLINCVFTGHGFKWIVGRGESLAGQPRTEGNSHLCCRIESPLEHYYTVSVESGSSQHWLVCSGHRSAELRTICDWLGIEFLDLDERIRGRI